jgi:hypothetical protein|tara:strand:+ start:248 stop:406 length:159 start_codon:yes stop_codon:yes gene_type:complete
MNLQERKIKLEKEVKEMESFLEEKKRELFCVNVCLHEEKKGHKAPLVEKANN